jgi:hypothetical protein
MFKYGVGIPGVLVEKYPFGMKLGTKVGRTKHKIQNGAGILMNGLLEYI